jgi:hypothetical protein
MNDRQPDASHKPGGSGPKDASIFWLRTRRSDVALAAKRATPNTEMVWLVLSIPVGETDRTGPVQPDPLRRRSLERVMALRVVPGDRVAHGTQELDRQRHQLGRAVADQGKLLRWLPDRASPAIKAAQA